MTPKYRLNWKMKLVFWLASRGQSPHEADLQKMRAAANSRMLSGLVFRHVSIANIENRSIPGREGAVPIRIYRPLPATSLPIIVYFHGGGWVFGGLDGHDAVCRRLAVENGAVVVSVEYRLAPEHKYPMAVHDAYDATCWTASHASELGADPDKLVVMGDSAGGNLAAVVSLMSRDLNTPRIAFQVLLYPSVDLVGVHPSKELYDDTPLLNRQAMIYYRDQSIGQPADLEASYASPLLASDVSQLPPALILTAEYDPLRDEGKAYADRLREAGNEVSYFCYPGMVHGFISFGWLGTQTSAAFARIRQTLQRFAAGYA